MRLHLESSVLPAAQEEMASYLETPQYPGDRPDKLATNYSGTGRKCGRSGWLGSLLPDGRVPMTACSQDEAFLAEVELEKKMHAQFRWRLGESWPLLP